MAAFSLILLSVILVSLGSFAGVFFLALKKEQLKNLLGIFVSFAGGSLLGSALLHLLPESVSQLGENSFILVLTSFLAFFILEKFLRWRHCHKESCDAHAVTYLNLLGDGIHNFVDGAIIAGSFLTSIPLGVSTTLAVVLHEIPQEIGDFSILVYGGWKPRKALLFNFISALTAVAGAAGVYFFAKQVAGFIPLLLPIAAGGFIYIAGTDIIPELHKKRGAAESGVQFASLAAGAVLMWLLKILQTGTV